MSGVRVSVMIPTYERGALAEEAARSALAQEVAGLEVIVSDNASRDDTAQRFERLGREAGERLRFVRQPENVGMTENFRRCLALARGTYGCFLCSDDLIEPGALEATCAALDADPSASFAFTRVRYLGGRSGHTSHRFAATTRGADFVRRSLFEARNFAFLASTTFRVEHGRQVAIFDTLFFDWTFWLGLADRGRVCFVDRVLAAHRYHPGCETGRVAETLALECGQLQQAVRNYAALGGSRLGCGWAVRRLFLRYAYLAASQHGRLALSDPGGFGGLTVGPFTRALGRLTPVAAWGRGLLVRGRQRIVGGRSAGQAGG